jgi:DNA replication initiation complex subunit (GINS family)
MFTYSEFIRIRRQEQEDSRTLSKLTNDMLASMKEYIAINKKSLEEANKMDDVKRSEEISIQIKNAISTLDQLFTVRMGKIANMAVLGINTEQARGNMTSQELIFFDSLLNLVNEHKGKLLKEIKEVPPQELQKVEEDSNTNKMVIKVIADVPRFVWKNNKTYGPFSFPNIVEIDRDVAEILIKGGKAIGV